MWGKRRKVFWRNTEQLLQAEGWRGQCKPRGAVGQVPEVLSASLRANRLWEERSDLKSSPKLLPHVLAQHSLALFIAQAADGVSSEVWELGVNCRYKMLLHISGDGKARGGRWQLPLEMPGKR